MDIRTVLFLIICVGFMLISGCTSTTPAPATPIPATAAAPATPVPVATTAAPVPTETVAVQTTTTPVVVMTQTTISPVKIFATTKSYSPDNAANPGLELSVITSLDTSTARYDWSATYGEFVTMSPQVETVNVVGPKITTNGGKVYWTFSEKPASTDELPVLVKVIVSEVSGKELGRSTATLAWKDTNTVVVEEIV